MAIIAVILAVVLLFITGTLQGNSAHRANPGRPPNGGAPLSSTPSESATIQASTTPAARHQPRPAVQRSAGPSQLGAYRVGLTALSFVEPSNAGTANAHTASGQPARTLPTGLRYPAGGRPTPNAVRGASPERSVGRFPLIIFSQGFNYPAEGYAALMDAWASAGYIVVDPTYPFTDPTTPGGPNESDIVNHPADLRYVISAVHAAARMPSSPLHGILAGGSVAAIGQSDGGDVSLAAAANTCCRDRRIGAAVILSGAELPAFDGTYYGTGSPPLLVFQGDQDTINLPGCSAALYDQAPPPKYYVDLLGAPHLPPYVDPGPRRSHIAAAVIGFLNAYLKGQADGLAQMRHAATLRDVATITTVSRLAGRGTYCPP